MLRKSIIIKGLILLVVGVLASTGWAAWWKFWEMNREERRKEQPVTETQEVGTSTQGLSFYQIKFVAEKIMENTKVLQIQSLISLEREIIAYEFVFCRKTSINYLDFAPFIKDNKEFLKLASKAKSINEIYNLLIKSEILDLNATVFTDYFEVLVISASKDNSPYQFEYKGLPMTYKLKFEAKRNLERIDPQAIIINDYYLYFKIPWIYYYFETDSGNKYLLAPDGRIKKVSDFKNIEFKKYSPLKREIQEKQIKEAREKWDRLLEGYKE